MVGTWGMVGRAAQQRCNLFGWVGTDWAGPTAGNHLFDGLVASRSAR
jgi:hypothetical protein